MFAPILAAAFAIAAAPKRPAEGGANQRAAVSGCMNQWLFNGVWRLRVTGVEPTSAYGSPGFDLALEMRNGTTKTLDLATTGVRGADDVTLVASTGDGLKQDENVYNTLALADVIQGASIRRKLLYYFPAGTPDADKATPAKFVMLIDKKNAAARSGVRFTVADPSFRVDLTCDKAKA